jgi:hypothetical protein
MPDYLTRDDLLALDIEPDEADAVLELAATTARGRRCQGGCDTGEMKVARCFAHRAESKRQTPTSTPQV